MKKKLAAILAAICFLPAVSCGYTDTPEESQPSGLFSKKTTAASAAVTTETVTTTANTDQFRSYQLGQKYDYILRDFGYWENKEQTLEKLDKTYHNICNYYSASLDSIISSQPASGKITFITGKSFTDLMNYSPLAYELYQYRNKLCVNPVMVMDSLTKISRHKNSPDEFSEYYIDRSDASRNPRLFQSPTQLIRDYLRTYIAPLDYDIKYSSEENLYYVYIISGEENVSASAVYFSFENNVLKRIGIDNMVYTGGQLAIVDNSQKFAHEKPLNDDMSVNGSFIYYGSEKTTLNNLTDMATAMLGSATSTKNLITNGKVTSEDLLRLDYVMTSDDTPYGVKGVYYSTWFTISK